MKSTQLFAFIVITVLLLSCNEGAASLLKTPKPVIAKAEVRYLADQRELSSDLRLFRGDSMENSSRYLPPPGTVSFLGSAMEARSIGPNVRWRSRMRVDFPEKLRFAFPIDSLQPEEKSTIPFEVSKVVADSIPATISKNQRLSFYMGRQALIDGESVVLFFEPENRQATPRRVIFAGPSKANLVNIPKDALKQIAPGNYEAYLVKQGIRRDTIDGLISAVTFQYHTRSKAVVVTE